MCCKIENRQKDGVRCCPPAQKATLGHNTQLDEHRWEKSKQIKLHLTFLAYNYCLSFLISKMKNIVDIKIFSFPFNCGKIPTT